MGANDHEATYTLSPLPDGGWRADFVTLQLGGWPLRQKIDFRADWLADPTGEVAYANALAAIDTCRRESPVRDRRTDHATRQTVTMLRLCEAKAADYLPPDLMLEMTAAIDGVVNLLVERLRTGEAAP